jgi:hypothetical protein
MTRLQTRFVSAAMREISEDHFECDLRNVEMLRNSTQRDVDFVNEMESLEFVNDAEW